MSGRAITIIVIVLFLLLVGYFSWGSSNRDRPIDPALVEQFETQQKPILDRLAKAKTDTQRSQLWGEMRQSMDSLNDDQRRQMGRLMRNEGERREDEKITSFFQLTPAQQTAALDKEIDESERRRQRFAAERAKNESDPDKNRQRTSKSSGSSTTSGKNSGVGRGGPGGGAPGGGPGGWGSAESKQRFFQKYLNNTSPESRAMRASYSARMDDRRAQRGLPTSNSGSRG